MKKFNILRIYWKIWFLGEGRGSWKTGIEEEVPWKWGTWTISRFKGWTWQEQEGGDCFWGVGWYLNAHYTLGKTAENTPWKIKLRLPFPYILRTYYITALHKFQICQPHFCYFLRLSIFFPPYSNQKMLFFLSLDQVQTETAFVAPSHYHYLVMILWRKILESFSPASFSSITTIIVNIQSSWIL